MKKGKIVLIVVVAFLAIGVISGIVHNVAGTTPEESSKETETETSALDMPEEIIWNDKDNMGILNLELDGTKTKQGIAISKNRPCANRNGLIHISEDIQ